jgi:hypothetical protein
LYCVSQKKYQQQLKKQDNQSYYKICLLTIA